MKALFSIAVVVAIAGCTRPPLEASENSFSKYGHPNYIKDDAQAHCAKYGKTAKFSGTSPVNQQGVISTFDCV